VGYPGHFLCRIYPQGVPVLVDCFGNGQVHLQATLLEPESDLTRQQRAELRKTATPVGTLVRVLNNLAAAFEAAERQEDFQFVQRLRAMIED
jgi:regulator of sirC expression with transglutaminase-like and TPR domain